MLTDRDPELTSAYTMVKVMQSLLDPDNMITAPNMKSERHEFLTFFYRRSMETLCRPLYANTENDTLKRGKVTMLTLSFKNRSIRTLDKSWFFTFFVASSWHRM